MSLLDTVEKLFSICGSVVTILTFGLLIKSQWSRRPGPRSETHQGLPRRWLALLVVGIAMVTIGLGAGYLGDRLNGPAPERTLDETITLDNSNIPQRSFDIAGWKFVEEDSYGVTINCRSVKVPDTGCEEGRASYFDFDPGDGFALGRAKGGAVNKLSTCTGVTYGLPELPVREGDLFCAWKSGKGVTAFKITRLPNPTPAKGQITVRLEAASWPRHEP